MNPSVSPVYVIALLRKSTATDFLLKVREKHASEVSKAGELIEADVGCLSFVLSFTFYANRGFPLTIVYPD